MAATFSSSPSNHRFISLEEKNYIIDVTKNSTHTEKLVKFLNLYGAQDWNTNKNYWQIRRAYHGKEFWLQKLVTPYLPRILPTIGVSFEMFRIKKKLMKLELKNCITIKDFIC